MLREAAAILRRVESRTTSPMPDEPLKALRNGRIAATCDLGQAGITDALIALHVYADMPHIKVTA